MTTETPHLREPQGSNQLRELLKRPSEITTVLFDMDGLLVDTETLGIRVAIAVCKNLNIDVNLEEQHSFIGITVEKFYRELFNKRGVDQDVAMVLGEHFEIYEELLETGLNIFDGAHTLPKDLKIKGYKLGLVSGSTKNQIEIILDKLQVKDEFDVIVSYNDITRSKPDPEGYLIAAKKLGVESKNCLVFEDAHAGILAAKSAGMKAVGVINNGGQDFSSADFVIDNLAAVESNL